MNPAMSERPSPQDYLDDLRAIGIPRLFQPHMAARERAAGIRRARQELGRLRGELSLHRDGPRENGSQLDAAELRRHAAPFNLLLLLHEQLVDEVNELERSLSSGKPLPYSFDFGQFIFGNEAAGEWYVGDQQQYDEWLDIQRFKRRLDAVVEQGKPAREELGKLRGKLESLNDEHEKRQTKIENRQEISFVLRRIAMLVILMLASGIVGWFYFNSDRALSLVAIGLTIACVLLIPVVILNWKSPRTRAASKQVRLEREILELQQQGVQQRQQYQPLELQTKALEVHYSRMMDNWEEARRVKSRLDSFIEEGKPLRERIDGLRAELDTLRIQREKLQKKLDARHSRIAFLRRMFLHIMLVIASGAVGFYYEYTGDADWSAIFYGLGAFCILLVPLAYIDWRNHNGKLESRLRQVETRMRQLQTEGKQVMKRYHPIELQIKTLIAQYKRTRAGISTSAGQAPG